MTDKPIYAWHFSTDELDFDKKGTKVEAGLTVAMDDVPILKYKGFHACIRPLDALHYFSQRPNPNNLIIASRVRLAGQTIDDSPTKTEHIVVDDKYAEIESVSSSTIPINIVAQKREHLWIADAKSTVEAFGEHCYEAALRLLREKNHAIAPIFDDAIKARQENSANLADLVKSARDEAETSTIELIKPLLERLAASLIMNTIEFALVHTRPVDYGHRVTYRQFPRDEDLPLLRLSYAYQELQASNHTKLHDMLMQLAPEGHHEP